MSTPTRATYRTMAEGTAEDYALIDRAEEANNAGLVPRVLNLVEALADGQQAYPISRLDHSLQSATRAFDDGRSVEYVVAALLHDIGDTYAPHAHGAFAAAVTRSLCVGTSGLDRQGPPRTPAVLLRPSHGRCPGRPGKYRGHQWLAIVWSSARSRPELFEHGIRAPSPLEFFRPMVEQIFAREPWTVTH